MFPRPVLTFLAGLLLAGAAHAGEITLFTHDDFRGREVTLREPTPDLVALGFNDRASSIIVRSGRWEVCVDSEFRGQCVVFERGEYRSLPGLNDRISSVREVGTGRDRGGWYRPNGRRGMIELFTEQGMNGNSTRLVHDMADFVQIGFNDRARSMVVTEGTWQLCSDAGFRGDCRVYRPGSYPDLGWGLGGQVSSARLVSDDDMRNPPPQADRDVPVLLFMEQNLRGRSVGLRGETPDFVQIGFNDAAGSMVIQFGTWEFCVDSYFRGQCRIFGPGEYRNLDGAMWRSISSARMVAEQGGPGHVEGEVELFSGPDFTGARLPLRGEVRTLVDMDFNDRAGSIIVHRGQWEFCVHADFRGQCVVYGPGRYGRLGSLNNQISSLRRVR
jgi:hypothetical protein